MSRIAQRSLLTCDNCGRYGHMISKCYASGGGIEGQAPWNWQNKEDAPQRMENNQARSANVQPSTHTQSPGAFTSRDTNTTNPAQYRQSASQRQCHTAMMAHISNATEEDPAKITISTNMSTLLSFEPNSHYWFIDSAATSHICGNINLFQTIEDISPIVIETASGDVFEANKLGTVRITIRSDPPATWRTY
jgi:Pol polyprotein, beta-barrel domain